MTNDLCVTRPWTTKKVWSWRGRSHINILESAATLKLSSSMARSGGDVRYVNLVDSNVARSVLTPSSHPVKALLHQNSAVALAYRFSPTRSNRADHPTRNAEFPPLAVRSLLDALDLDELYGLLSVNSIKRAFANWVRLALLLSPALVLSIADPSSYRRHGIFVSLPPDCSLDFDATLGYPGGGPYGFFIIIFVCFPNHLLRDELPVQGSICRREDVFWKRQQTSGASCLLVFRNG